MERKSFSDEFRDAIRQSGRSLYDLAREMNNAPGVLWKFAQGHGGISTEKLDKLAEVLKPFANPIRVEGHTDDRPIHTTAFPSNWELSSARAASVVHLFMDRGVAPDRLSVMGFGEYRPVMPNDGETGRNANRRVEVMILSQQAAESP